MRPLHVLDTSPPLVAGYTSRARAVLLGQRAAGMRPVALTGLRQGAGSRAIDELDGIAYHRTAPPVLWDRASRLPGAREAVEMAALAGRIAALHERVPFDLVHAHSPVLCGVPAHALALKLGLPSVYEVRAFWEDAAVNQGRGGEGSPRYAATRWLETVLARSVDALVVLCDGLRRDLVARGIPSERIHTVPNGVDTKRFVPAPPDRELALQHGLEGKIVVAYIGTFFRFEGVARLLDALARIIARDDRVRGLVVGHGETEAELRTHCERLALGDKVVFTGKVAPSDVARYYALADVLCYPRERHRITELTTPLKPLEAMSHEKAVVASDVGGLCELVDDDRTGVLFRAGDVDDLARTIERLVGDAALRMRLGQAARRHVVERRDWSKLARRYDEIYASAIEHSRWRQRRAA